MQYTFTASITFHHEVDEEGDSEEDDLRRAYDQARERLRRRCFIDDVEDIEVESRDGEWSDDWEDDDEEEEEDDDDDEVDPSDPYGDGKPVNCEVIRT